MHERVDGLCLTMKLDYRIFLLIIGGNVERSLAGQSQISRFRGTKSVLKSGDICWALRSKVRT
jgi:hypothetical protein